MTGVTLVVETGAGTPGANAYCTRAFVTAYLRSLGRETENDWLNSAPALQDAAIIAGTLYLDQRWGPHLRGTPLRPEIVGRVAKGSLDLGANATNGTTVTIGQVVYRFVTTLAQENDVLIGATADDSVKNLERAVNSEDAEGGYWHEDTRTNLEATAEVDEDDASILRLFAFVAGENGNAIALATTVTGATVSGATFAGGIDTAPQPRAFPKACLYTARGEPVVGVPLKVKQATAEYAVRAIADPLSLDPTSSSTGALVKRTREKVGPIEEETEYVDGGQPQAWKSYPLADAMLADFVNAGGRTVR